MNHPTEVRAGRAPVRGDRRDGRFRRRGCCHRPDSEYEGNAGDCYDNSTNHWTPLLMPPCPQFPSGVAGKATATCDGLRPLPRLSIASHTRTSAERSGRCLPETDLVVHTRAGELVALRVGSLDVLTGSIPVTEAASEVRGELTFGPTKTGRSRVVGIPRFLAQMLGEHIGRYPSPDGFVFTARNVGRSATATSTAAISRPTVEKARSVAIAENRKDQAIPECLEVPRPSPHLCRHPHQQWATYGGSEGSSRAQLDQGHL